MITKLFRFMIRLLVKITRPPVFLLPYFKFINDYCVIAGNPAKNMKSLEKSKCVMYQSRFEYNGCIPHYKFEKFRKKNLHVIGIYGC